MIKVPCNWKVQFLSGCNLPKVYAKPWSLVSINSKKTLPVEMSSVVITHIAFQWLPAKQMHHRRASDNSSNCLPANDRKKNIVRWEKRIQLIPRLSCRICSLFSDRCLDVTACASFSCWSYQEKKKKQIVTRH